jgi:deoxyribodipyrimidine photolyase-related protein
LEVIQAAESAYKHNDLPIAAVEGFIRQILGWREFIRGVYWLDMPNLGSDNYFGHEHNLPKWFWTGQTHMNCLKESIGQTLQYGYAHHIQRLMVMGNFALLAELNPKQVSEWYHAIYVDAVEWVEHPNTLGMALYANGGRFTSKPYISSGAYIKRMSNYCQGCRYQPDIKTGAKACPYTSLYWNFLDKHESKMLKNPRTALMAKNVQRLNEEQREAIRQHSKHLLNNLDSL